MIKFQSTPVISDGRIPAGKRPCWQSQGFNPRPSFLTGESHRLGHKVHHLEGFNPRPSFLTGESACEEFK